MKRLCRVVPLLVISCCTPSAEEMPRVTPTAEPAPSATAPTSATAPVTSVPAPAAAATPAAKDVTPTPATGSTSFAMIIKTRSSDGPERILYPGESMRSRDRFWLELRVFEPLHVNVIWISPKGEATPLLPSESDLTLQPGDARRVPDEPESFFQLDSIPGDEQLLVVGSRKPIVAGDPAIKSMVQRMTAMAADAENAAKGDAPAAKSPPARAELAGKPMAALAAAPRARPLSEGDFEHGTRGITYVKKGSGTSLLVTPDAGGTFVVPVVIHHTP